MVDFLMIATRSKKNGVVEIYPKFKVGRSKDLMIRGGDFYAVWLEELGLWSTDEEDVIRLVDRELDNYANELKKNCEDHIYVMHMWDSETCMIDVWHKYCQRQMRDCFCALDENLVFSNQETKKEDYASKRLQYPLLEGKTKSYDELMSVLYSKEERHKIEWTIGAIVTGASKNIQKFLVFYGGPGTGKSTVLNIIQKLFDGYCAVFDAKALGSSTDAFALEAFKANPLVAIQHDGDLSRIEDNTRLNSLVSHETMTVNEKHKALYSTRFNTFLIMGSNKYVKITDGKSGLTRRLIDVQPTGDKIPINKYNKLVKQIDFELGAIAYHCKNIFEENPEYYDNYKPIAMMGESNDFYNFILDCYTIFKLEDSTTLKAAWEMYKVYVEEARVPYSFSMRAFKSELKNYFRTYEERTRVDGLWVRSYYSGFKYDIFENEQPEEIIELEKQVVNQEYIEFKEQESILDQFCSECPAQYGNSKELPRAKWENVETKLKDLDTRKLHYLKVPENLIVIDFDIKDEHGNKSFERNLEEASKWPKTYAELSKSGGGIHLHYLYDGDTSRVSRIYGDNIEIKIFTGNSSLRRKVTKCNNEPIATISSGLPMKGETKVVNFESIKNEKALRTIIQKNLNKEYMGATKPSVDFIFKVLEDAYSGGLKYDVTDMKNSIIAFAASSSNQADYCIKQVAKMHFKSEENSSSIDSGEQPIVFYDVEVFPNLLLINYKMEGPNTNVIRLINPSPKEIERLMKYKLVGFNCRRYDNHILYARLIGWSNEQIYALSQTIVSGQDRSVFFGEAYNISYTDIYDYASKKQSLKKWEIELGIHHQELGLPWDKPVPESMWEKVAEYCDNDVISTEAVWNATKGDFTARQILADLAGMSVNDTTNSLTTRIIFGKEKHPQLIYTDLSETFPGYKFEKVWNTDIGKYEKHNWYRDTDLGFGGYVYANPGMYGNVALLDIASLHPHSIKAMNVFGEYTKNFTDIMDTRIFIKHQEYDKARKLFNGKLSKYLDDESTAKQLSQALKIAINSVYGLTSATFDNPFKDKRNENNIVALRGALFMRTLQDEVIARGYKVAHIKTDSIKIPDATPEIIDFCMEFAKKYGYTFEHEATYERMCLVNDAVYIAKYKDGEHAGEWTATGTQFAVPYVFKKCFSKEPIVFRDMCEAKEVKTAMYLNFNEGLPEGTDGQIRFVGRVGLYCPIKPGCGGAELVKEAKKKDGSIGYDAVTGTKGFRWLESEEVYSKGLQDQIDHSYYAKLVDAAIDEISKYGDYEWFVSDDPYQGPVIFDGKPQYEDYCPF